MDESISVRHPRDDARTAAASRAVIRIVTPPASPTCRLPRSLIATEFQLAPASRIAFGRQITGRATQEIFSCR